MLRIARGVFRTHQLAVAALTLSAIAPIAQALPITVSRTVDPPGLQSVDGCGTFCSALPGVTFSTADFPSGSLITDVDVSIAWFKTDGSCTAPGAGNAFHEETNFRIDVTGGPNVVLGQPGTWSGSAATGTVVTGFDQSAGVIPSGVPSSGTFLPNNGDLSTFDGQSALGTFILRAGDTGSGDPLCVDSYSVTVTAETPPVVINEVDADTTGTDTLEFVELYDGGLGNQPLDGFVVVLYNGSNDQSYAAFDLDGFATDANGYFVLGNAAVANVSLVFADNTLQNGADAVALYAGDATSFPNGTVVTATNLLDAMVYDTDDADDAGLLALLLPGQPQINENAGFAKDTESNQRCPNGSGGPRATSTYSQETPTPGSANCLVADLAITKTDGVTSAAPGGSVTYTITASNAGPSAAPGSSVTDTFPAACSGVTWTCVGAGGGTCTASGSGNIADTVNLPAGASVTFTATCPISAMATGTLSNTATASAPAGVSDPAPGNNSATDTDTLDPQADLAITKTDGVTSAVPGGSVTYTITASNAGPSAASGSTVTDTFPASCAGVTWTCGGAGGGSCTASGSGNISDSVSLPAGASVTYTATCPISATATGTLSNTATVSAPAGVTDSAPGNNSATDTDTLAPQADLAITKTDGVTSAVPGGSVTYTIAASNAGPSAASSSTVTDTFPASCAGVTWTCVGAGGGTCTASGSGNISDSVSLPAGASVTYTATCLISATATGTLSNTATVSAPAGVTDPAPGNNSATDTDTLEPSADLSLTKAAQNVPDPLLLGSTFSYLLSANNAGPSNVADAVITDPLPSTLSYVADDCGGSFSAPTFTWNLGALDAGSSASCTLTVSVVATGSIDNTATITSSASDPQAVNNASASTLVGAQPADVVIAISASASSGLEVGAAYTYTVTGSNAGPGPAIDLDFTLALPNTIAILGNSCGATVSGTSLAWSVATLANGESTACTVNVQVLQPRTITAQAMVASVSSDPELGNNTASLVLGTAAVMVPTQDRSTLLLLIMLIAGMGWLAVRART